MVRIAFVCIENAGRSQMAAAFARAHVPDGVEIVSGGTTPAGAVHPEVVEAMRERGIDLSDERPTKVGPEDLADCDFVITMGCSKDDVCPARFRGDARDWALPDPKGRPLEDVRRIRDEIEERVLRLLQEVAAAEGGSTGKLTDRPRRRAVVADAARRKGSGRRHARTRSSP